MRIIDVLLGEHGVFYAQFDRLEMVLPAIDAAREIHELAALLGSGLAGHARAEDELLFAPVIAEGIAPGALGQMAEEHREIEAMLDRAQRATTAGAAREALLDAIALARAHFRREEQIVFPALQERGDSGSLAGLAARWAERRGVALRDLTTPLDTH